MTWISMNKAIILSALLVASLASAEVSKFSQSRQTIHCDTLAECIAEPGVKLGIS
jgi:hypothetical protein